MCEKEYINLQTKEVLDLERVTTLPDNAMLKVKPELWIEWDFEKNDELSFDIWDITKCSNKKVYWICIKCGSSYDTSIDRKTLRNASCSYCAGRKVNHTNSLVSLRPDLASEWHPNKNGDLTPNEVTCGKDKKVWWLGECGHEWEAKISNRSIINIGCPYCSGRYATKENCLAVLNPKLASEWHPTRNGDLTPKNFRPKSGAKAWWICDKGHEWDAVIYSRVEGNGCPYCANQKALKGYNDMWTTNPELASLLADPNDGYKYMQWSGKKVDWKCPDCGEIIKSRTVSQIKRTGLSCPSCSDGIYYPEKFMYNLLKELNIEFIKELSSKKFDWVRDKRYDFYIPSLNMIIETHGEQHSGGKGFESAGGRTLDEEQENDKYKRELALRNGIKHYIEMDCRNSNMEYIRNSIMNSELVDLFDLSNVDWGDIGLKSEKSLVFVVCDLWNKGMSRSEMVDEMKLCKTTIIKYLIRGSKIGICNYSKHESRMRGQKNNAKNKSKKVVQLSLEGKYISIWDSISEASRGNNLKCISHISIVCKGKRKSAGGYKWMYKEDYDKYIEEQNNKTA